MTSFIAESINTSYPSYKPAVGVVAGSTARNDFLYLIYKNWVRIPSTFIRVGRNFMSQSSHADTLDRFLKASEEMMQLGLSYSGNIDSSIESFKQRFASILKTHFLEKAVAEMLAESFAGFEKDIRKNLKGIDGIYTEGGQWYAFCFGSALGRPMEPPASMTGIDSSPITRARNAS